MSSETIYSAIRGHRSIRSYTSDPIAPEIVERILEAGLRASSSGNMQAYSVIVTTDLRIRRELSEAHFHQPMLMEAPMLLTFCADFHRMRRWLKLSEAPDNFDNLMSFMIATIDAVLASQNVALAAEVEGLGLCYMGTTLASCRQIAKILSCPKGVVPVVGFSVGYPNENPPPRDRLPLHSIVHREHYKVPTDQDVLSAYRERERAGWERYQAIPDLQKRIRLSDVRNLAQVYTKLKYTQQSHIEYSKNILNCLRDQGFWDDTLLQTEPK